MRQVVKMLIAIQLCRDPDNRDKRLEDWKRMLLDRKYKEQSINSDLSKTRSIPRHIALRKFITKKKT